MKLTKDEIHSVKKALKDFYAPDGPERVGFIGQQNNIMEVPNSSKTPMEGFIVDPKDTIAALDKGAWATWHTHPNQDANLSGEDHRMFVSLPYMTHFIIGSDGVKAYYYDQEKKAVLTV